MAIKNWYHVVAPSPFTRREGPWPERAFTAKERWQIFQDNSRQVEQQLDERRMFHWYRNIAGAKTDPRRKRKGAPHPFGVVPLHLTPADWRKFRREFPELMALPRRPCRLPKPGRLSSTGEIFVDTAAEADFWHLEFLGLPAARAANRVKFGHGIKIAVVDSGISQLHPEFINKAIVGVDLDPISGKFLRFDGDDTHGHGTHVASLIAGSTIGIAPEADLVAVRLFRNGEAEPVAIMKALEWIVDPLNGQDVQLINLSGGFYEDLNFQTIITQILKMNILVVCASGNTRGKCLSPGNYDAVLTVGACTRARAVWDGPGNQGSGSVTIPNTGTVVPDVLAPGADIWGASLGDRYGRRTGTSQATPIISGLAALEIEKRQKAVTVDQVINTIMNRTDPPPAFQRSARGIVHV